MAAPEVSFMVWLLIGALGVPIADDFGLAPPKGLLVACPFLGGALLRVCVGWPVIVWGQAHRPLLLAAKWSPLCGDGWVIQSISTCSASDSCWGSEAQVLPWRCRWRGEPILRPIKEWRWALPRPATAERCLAILCASIGTDHRLARCIRVDGDSRRGDHGHSFWLLRAVGDESATTIARALVV